MKWYHYVACFFAGAFLTNAIPHLVNGISGDAFPTPFADPPGKGPSPPMLNVAWAFFNLVVGYLLYRAGKLSRDNKAGIAVFLVAAFATAMMLADTFAQKTI